jgi:ketosteroid isomerase-like protein
MKPERRIFVLREETSRIIQEYIRSYNSFDVEGIVKLLNKDIEFRNISNGEINTETKGIQKFRELAEKSAEIFSSRRQEIIDFQYFDNRVVIEIDYEGVLAIDLPNGLKAGDKIELKGRSIFIINNGKISSIEDYS